MGFEVLASLSAGTSWLGSGMWVASAVDSWPLSPALVVTVVLDAAPVLAPVIAAAAWDLTFAALDLVLLRLAGWGSDMLGLSSWWLLLAALLGMPSVVST